MKSNNMFRILQYLLGPLRGWGPPVENLFFRNINIKLFKDNKGMKLTLYPMQDKPISLCYYNRNPVSQ